MREDPMLERMLGQHRGAVAGGTRSADHPDVDTLARHAAGQLGPERARDVASHLLACDDGRCVAFVRSQAEDGNATQDMLYPSDSDAPARTRTFQCKAGLWDQFAEMAQERGIPLDELIEEAMTAYARMRGHLDAPTDPKRQPPPGPGDETMEAAFMRRQTKVKPPPTELDDSDSMPAMAARDRANQLQARFPSSVSKPTPPPGTIRMPGRPLPAPGRSGGMPSLPVPAGHPPVPPPPQRTARLSSGSIPAVPPPPARSGGLPAAPSARSLPPAMPSQQPAPPVQPMSTMKSARSPHAPAPTTPTLTLTYQGRPYVVDKDRFLLGRSKNGADLRLDDANVSRQHAMIEKVGGAYYVVDLGSTNGVFVSGERVARRALRDGDVIEITTHTITCSLL